LRKAVFALTSSSRFSAQLGPGPPHSAALTGKSAGRQLFVTPPPVDPLDPVSAALVPVPSLVPEVPLASVVSPALVPVIGPVEPLEPLEPVWPPSVVGDSVVDDELAALVLDEPVPPVPLEPADSLAEPPPASPQARARRIPEVEEKQVRRRQKVMRRAYATPPRRAALTSRSCRAPR